MNPVSGVRPVRAFLIFAVAFVAAVFTIPIIWSSCTTHAYYYEGRCACGHNCYARIAGDGLFRYSPGHGVPEYRAFTLRPRAGQWDIMGLPHSPTYYSALEGPDKVIGQLKFHNGALCQKWSQGNAWVEYPRVHNPWPILLAKIVEDVHARWGLF